MTSKRTGKCTKQIDNQLYRISHDNDSIFQLPRSKKERVEILKKFVTNECDKCWSILPREVATLKREFLRELVRSI